MTTRLLADFVLVIHLAYVVFVVLGGVWVLKWWKAAWLHVPAVLWAAIVEYAGWICPLTPIENWFLMKAGEPGYQGDFLGRCLGPVLYPDNLTREMQLILGTLVVTVNVVIYGYVFLKRTPRWKP
jgi:hypothetical protein